MGMFGNKGKNFDWGAAAASFFGADPAIFQRKRAQRRAEAENNAMLDGVRDGLKKRGITDGDIAILMADPRQAAAWAASTLAPPVAAPGHADPSAISALDDQHDMRGFAPDGNAPALLTDLASGVAETRPKVTIPGMDAVFGGAGSDGYFGPLMGTSPPTGWSSPNPVGMLRDSEGNLSGEDLSTYAPFRGAQASSANWGPSIRGSRMWNGRRFR